MTRYLMIGAGGLGLAAVLAVGAWIAVAWTVETPPHGVITKDGPFELRDYPALRVAEVQRTGPRQDAVRAGFGPLARYIFARQRDGEKIAMTAPVTQVPQSGDTWSVQFIMPSGYGLADLPAPADADIALHEWPATRRAAIRFSGVATDALIADAEARLRAWMGRQGLRPAGPPIYAYYNDPLTPGFLRRNEVLIPVDTPAG